MYAFDPRTVGAYQATNGVNGGFAGVVEQPTAPYISRSNPYVDSARFYNSGISTMGAHGNIGYGSETTLLAHRIEELQVQISLLNGLVRRLVDETTIGARLDHSQLVSQNQRVHGYQAHNMGAINNFQNVHLKETDSQLALELFLPNLSMGDVAVEVSGNKIICRTLVPVNPAARWWATAALPRGFEFFELADGRVEFTWLAPVAFQAKSIEAYWRDGFMCLTIPKTETTQRQSVKVTSRKQ